MEWSGNRAHSLFVLGFYGGCFVFLLAFGVASFNSCAYDRKAAQQLVHREPERYPFFDSAAYVRFFMEYGSICNDTAEFFAPQLVEFYHHRNAPYWTAAGYPSDRLHRWVNFLAQAEAEAVPLSYLAYDSIAHCIDQLENGDLDNEQQLYTVLVQLEQQLTTAFLRYAQAMNYGLTQPQQVHGKKWYYPMDTVNAQFFAAALTQIEHAESYIESLRPQDADYLILREQLTYYLTLRDTLFCEIPFVQAHLGDVNPVLMEVGKRLQLLREADHTFAPTDTLTPSLLAALNRFRKNRAIPLSDTLDAETVDALNWQPERYLRKLMVNMDRLRWKIVPQKGSDCIIVNIPDFTLQAWSADTLALQMKICCGKYDERLRKSETKAQFQVPQESETPLIYSEIDYVMLNPEWNIPEKIIRDEYYYKMLKNSIGIVEKEKLYILDKRTKQVVDPATINWSEVRRHSIPYRLVQTSGRHNALGVVRFNFPNSESVYLHDTNSKSAFRRRYRDLSHGCVRVEQPVALAELLFKMSGYDERALEEVQVILGAQPTTEAGISFAERRLEAERKYKESLGSDTLFYRPLRPTRKTLKKRMPLFIEYKTCFVGDGGEVQYRPDVYEKDSVMYLQTFSR